MGTGLREKAINLRKQGWSYSIISADLGVAKSTLSNWLKDVPYKPNDEVRKRIKEGPAKSVVVRHQKRMASIEKMHDIADKEIGAISNRDLMMLGIGLYIGEGSKIYESIRIINSDPYVILLALRWFKEICDLSNKNFSIAIHIYPDLEEHSVLKYWSNVTNIPLSQFGKTQIDARENKSNKKKRKLPYGTAHLTIKSIGNRNNGVLLHRRIVGWIAAINRQVRV